MIKADLIVSMRCPKCGHWQGRTIINPKSYVFKCDRCKKERKLMQKNSLGFQVTHKSFNTINEAIWYAVDQNNKDATDGFKDGLEISKK